MLEQWTTKYAPKKVSDIVSNHYTIKQLSTWLKNYKKTKNEILDERIKTNKIKKKSEISNFSNLILIGKHGVGKTSCLKVLLDKYNYDIRTLNFNEINLIKKDSKKIVKKKTKVPLDNSTKKLKKENKKIKKNNEISTIIKKILNKDNILNSIHNKKDNNVIILIDELESITSTSEKSIITELQKYNEQNWFFPIIFISNSKHNKFLTDLKKQSKIIYFNTPNEDEMLELMNKIIKNENLNIKNQNVKDNIIENCQGDMRRLIITLQDIKYSYEKLEITEEIIKNYYQNVKKKDIDFNLFNATEELLYNFNSIDDSLRLFELEKTLLPLMIHQNYPNYINKNIPSKNKYAVIEEITENLCDGDIAENFIYSEQNWDLQEIYGLLSCVSNSYALNVKNPRTINCVFPSDLNKSSIMKINAKNIEFADKYFNNLNIYDYINMNKILRKYIDKGEIKKSKYLLNNYKLEIEHIEKLLKIDKIKKSKNNLTLKQKREFIEILK